MSFVTTQPEAATEVANAIAIAYRTALGDPVESVGAIDPAVGWRASIRYRPRACALPPGTRIVDGYFRRADPLPGVYSVAHWRLGASRAVREILTDHVVAATGFDVALERIECLKPTLRAQIAREGPYSRLNANFETSVNGLFIVGLPAAPVFGPVQRFMFGATHAAPAVTKALRRSRTRDPIHPVPGAPDQPKLEVLQPDSA
jgi:hypothetical protein